MPRRARYWLALAAAALVWAAAAQAASDGGKASRAAREIPITGPIGPATADFVTEALAKAEAANAPVVILRLDTPGGLSASMRRIIKAILASPVPSVGYVAPSGARAASAGTYILYACSIAAMAPATNLGAATPVSIGPGGAPKQAPKKPGGGADTPDQSADPNNAPADSATAERRKIVNDAVAYIRGLAEQNNRNADWAEKAVREAASISAQTALDKNVVNLIAPSERVLLKRIDGRKVATGQGKATLATAGLGIETVSPDLRNQFLAFITNPTVALLLFMVGIVGLIGELFAPGTAVPGVVGGLSMIAALYAFHILPINYAGLGLVALGIGLIVAEAFVPSFGALGLGGLAAFVLGCVMLIDTPAEAFQIATPVIVLIAATTALLLILVAVMFARARRHRVHTAREGMIGSECVALEAFDGSGRVWLHGESWRAQSTYAVAKDDRLEVVGIDGLTVRVQPVAPTLIAAADDKG